MIPMDKEMTFPEKIVTFPVYQDVVPSDGERIKNYLEAIADNDFVSAGNALSQMNHFANKIVTTKDWQLMYDTVKAAKKVVDEFAPESETPGANLTTITLGSVEPTSPKKNDLWIDTTLSSYIATRVELESSDSQNELTVSLKTGETVKLTATVYSKESTTSTEEVVGHTSDTPFLTLVKTTKGKNATSSLLTSIYLNPNEYWTNGRFYIYVTPVKAGSYYINGVINDVGNAHASFTANFEVTSTNSIDIYYNGFTNDDYIFVIGRKANGKYTSLNLITSTKTGLIVKNRYLSVMQEEDANYPVVVRQLVSGTPTFTNVTSGLTDSGDRHASDLKLLCYEFQVTKTCGIDLVASDDTRRTDTTSSEYIGYYSADNVLLIDLDYTVNEEVEDNE